MLQVNYIHLPGEDSLEEFLNRFRNKIPERSFREISSYKSRTAALHRLSGELLLFHHVERYAGLKFDEIIIKYGEHGKPSFADLHDHFFNISHSGDYVVIALSDHEVGIDIEKRERARMSVAKRFFHPEELAELEQAGASRDRRFTDLWSIKESFLKYSGAGLTRPLNSFLVSEDGKPIFLKEDDNLIPVFIRECPIDIGYSCFVCSPIDKTPHMHRVSWDMF